MKKETARARLTAAITEFTALETGSRHPKLIKLAAAYRRAGFDEDAATEAIYGLYQQTWPDSPPAPREVENTIQKAYSEDTAFRGVTTHRVASLPPPQIIPIGKWLDTHPFEMTPAEKLADWRAGVREVLDAVPNERYASHQALQLMAMFRKTDLVYAGQVDGGKSALCYSTVADWLSTDERRACLAKANYITVNPLSRASRTDGDVSTHGNLLIEYDKPFDGSSEDALSPMSLDELGNHPDDPRLKQLVLLDYLIDAGLPIAAVTYSGGKSFHAVLKLANVRNKDEWDQKVKGLIYPLLSIMGADRANCNPARLTRLAGASRNGIIQELVYADMTCKPKDPEEIAAILKRFLAETGAFVEPGQAEDDDALTVERVQKFLADREITLQWNEMTRKYAVAVPEHMFATYEDAPEERFGTLLTDASEYFKSRIKRFIRPNLEQRLKAIASKNSYHPVVRRLAKTAWDGVDRITPVIDTLEGLNPAFKPVVRKWFWQTVAMVHNKGEYDAAGVLILSGPNGTGKTSFFRLLTPDPEVCFREGVSIDISDRDTLIRATGAWIVELGEVEESTRKEQPALKAFITRKMDSVRLPYGREDITSPRRSSFCATTNEERILTDPTSYRRWWVMHIKRVDLQVIIDMAKDPENLWQFWAQAKHEWQENGERSYFPTADEAKALAAVAEASRKLLPHEDLILSKFDWDSPRESWEWRSSVDVADAVGLHRRDVNQLGKTLRAIAARMKLPDRMLHGARQYQFPKPQHAVPATWPPETTASK
jgi:hypothetical protein